MTIRDLIKYKIEHTYSKADFINKEYMLILNKVKDDSNFFDMFGEYSIEIFKNNRHPHLYKKTHLEKKLK